MLRRLLAVIAAVLLLSVLASCGNEDDSSNDSSEDPSAAETTEATESPSPSESETASGACEYVEDGSEPAKPVDPPEATPTETGDVDVTIATNLGDISATLDAEAAPCTVNSFLSLAEQGFYDDTPCPRITTTPGFGVLQCGDPTGTGSGGPGYSFADELTGEETYPAGTLAMANAGPDTNGSQFFIVYADTQLSPDYTVFGTVDEAAIKLVEKVAAKGDDGSNPAGGGAPNQKVTITEVTAD